DWNVAQDNGDCYHHVGLHRKSVEWLWPMKTIWYLPDNGHYAINGAATAPEHLATAEDGKPVMPGLFPPLPGLTAHQRENLYLVFIYPNYWIAPAPDQTLVTRLFPVAPGRVDFHTDVLFHRDNLGHPELTSAERSGSLDAPGASTLRGQHASHHTRSLRRRARRVHRR